MDKAHDTIEASRLEDLGVAADARSLIRRNVPTNNQALKRLFDTEGVPLSGQSNALAGVQIVLLRTAQGRDA